MVPTFLCLLFIGFLFWTDRKRPGRPSGATWVPLAWMFIAGSRFVSAWLNLSPSFGSASDLADGSPIDRAVFFGLIIAGLVILARRKADWRNALFSSKWVLLYYLYCLASMAWAEDPAVLAKRWVKELGNPVMVFVLLTERRPYEAIGAVLRRLSFLLLPLSVLFIKYFPALGRAYHWDGSPMYTGVGTQKNDLGLMCLVAGIYVAWELLKRRGKTDPALTRQDKAVLLILTAMLAWLLHMSDSQTSFVCLVTALFVFLLGRTRFVERRPSRIIGILGFAGFAAWIFNDVSGMKEALLNFLGRDPTLTNRTDIWRIVQEFKVNPIVGVGFMSFWSGDRLEELWRRIGGQINQAHNGYLEQYLNLGYIGVGFILIIVLTGILGVRRQLYLNYNAAMLRLCFIVVALLYNNTEASFYGINNMWTLLLLGCLEAPRQMHVTADAPLEQSVMRGRVLASRPPLREKVRGARTRRPL